MRRPILHHTLHRDAAYDPFIGRDTAEPRGCSVGGCDRPHKSRGWCRLHYFRWKSTGEPGPAEPLRKPREHGEVSYWRAHVLLKETKGRAAEHLCSHCWQPAEQWAYKGGCDDELTDRDGDNVLVYCLHHDHYMPLCRGCHNRYDRGDAAEALCTTA